MGRGGRHGRNTSIHRYSYKIAYIAQYMYNQYTQYTYIIIYIYLRKRPPESFLSLFFKVFLKRLRDLVFTGNKDFGEKDNDQSE